MADSAEIRARSVDVVVVGAGFAGLSAAEHLLATGGVSVAVVEASERVGGRAKSVPIPSRVRTGEEEHYELGATWIHGTAENPLVPLVCGDDEHVQREFIARHKTDWDEDLGVFVDAETGRQLGPQQQQYYEWLLDLFGAFEATTGGAPDLRHTSLKAYLARQLARANESDADDKSRELRARYLHWRDLLECTISACDSLSDLAVGHMAAYKHPLGPDVRVIPKGLGTVARNLAEALPEETVLLNHAVTSIDWDRPGSTTARRVVVRCSTGGNNNHVEFHADYVICTVSLGVLKHWTSTGAGVFIPPLPPWKAAAVDRMGFGSVDKVLLEFPKTVSTRAMGNRSCLWPIDASAVLAKHGMPRWASTIFGFSPYTDRTLELFVSGEAARELEGITDDDAILAVFRKLLLLFYGDVYTDSAETRPVALYRSTWFSDPNFRGSYTFMRPHSRPTDVLTIAEPLQGAQQAAPPIEADFTLNAAENEQEQPLCYTASRPLSSSAPDARLLFAGEATCQAFFSTVHAAILSGRREATRVLRSIGHAAKQQQQLHHIVDDESSSEPT